MVIILLHDLYLLLCSSRSIFLISSYGDGVPVLTIVMKGILYIYVRYVLTQLYYAQRTPRYKIDVSEVRKKNMLVVAAAAAETAIVTTTTTETELGKMV